jgi:hypothetical protein
MAYYFSSTFVHLRYETKRQCQEIFVDENSIEAVLNHLVSNDKEYQACTFKKELLSFSH